jgi:tetratricopeptide (TPR) repeat protein
MRTGFGRFALTLAAASVAAAVGINAQDDTRKLFESGQFQKVVEQTPDDAPAEAQYLKGLAQLRLGQNDGAKAAFGRLPGGGDAWRSVGDSAVALIDGNQDGALEAARAAVAADASLPAAHYQLGLALEARGDNPAAAEAFAKAAEANPQMAYAHYNAGMNYYKAKRIDRMAVYFENFLKLAPNAPEKPAVESIMRTVRGRQ